MALRAPPRQPRLTWKRRGCERSKKAAVSDNKGKNPEATGHAFEDMTSSFHIKLFVAKNCLDGKRKNQRIASKLGELSTSMELEKSLKISRMSLAASVEPLKGH